MLGFEVEMEHVGPGWQPIIKCVNEFLIDQMPGHRVSQIKEKFGGLRYYWVPPEGKVDETKLAYCHGVVGMAEALSFHVCEECGLPGELGVTGHWYRTLCTEHRAEAEAKYAERMAGKT